MSQVYVEHGLLPVVGQRLREAGLRGRAHVIADEAVHALHGEALLGGLERAGFSPAAYTVPAGEKTKSLEQAALLYDWLVERRAERGEAVLAFGGGVIGDLAGFVAATYLRGVPLVQLPTTLLAQIDSSIGGKVAVNHPRGKNLIGAFYPARVVFADVATLTTLPRRERASGWAEIVKTALILDAELLDLLESRSADLLALEPEVTATVIRRCVDHKLAIVAEDPREQGRRIILNYGHTIAHALEAATDYVGLLHGEAVAIGMAGAAAIARALGLLDPAAVERQNACLARFGLPVRAVGFLPAPPPVDLVVSNMGVDKKVSGRAVRWVLLEGIGRVRVEPAVPADLVRAVVSELLDARR